MIFHSCLNMEIAEFDDNGCLELCGMGLVLKTKQRRDDRPWFGRFPDPTRKGVIPVGFGQTVMCCGRFRIAQMVGVAAVMQWMGGARTIPVASHCLRLLVNRLI